MSAKPIPTSAALTGQPEPKGPVKASPSTSVGTATALSLGSACAIGTPAVSVGTDRTEETKSTAEPIVLGVAGPCGSRSPLREVGLTEVSGVAVIGSCGSAIRTPIEPVEGTGSVLETVVVGGSVVVVVSGMVVVVLVVVVLAVVSGSVEIVVVVVVSGSVDVEGVVVEVVVDSGSVDVEGVEVEVEVLVSGIVVVEVVVVDVEVLVSGMVVVVLVDVSGSVVVVLVIVDVVVVLVVVVVVVVVVETIGAASATVAPMNDNELSTPVHADVGAPAQTVLPPTCTSIFATSSPGFATKPIQRVESSLHRSPGRGVPPHVDEPGRFS